MRQIYFLFSANKTFSAKYAQITAINLRTAVFLLGGNGWWYRSSLWGTKRNDL